MDNKQLISKKHPDNCQLSTVNCQLSEFISDWKSASPYLEVQTSGSTGTPKRIMAANRSGMSMSAIGCPEGSRMTKSNPATSDRTTIIFPAMYRSGIQRRVRFGHT